MEIVNWPAVRDVQARLGYSGVHVNRLIRTGRLHAVRTRLGYLVDPASVEDFAVARDAQRAKQHAEVAVPV
jgi:hypothetical protein